MFSETEIQQKVFGSEYQKTILNILHTQNHIVGRMAEVFKLFGITRQQYNVLCILRDIHPEPASVNLIREGMVEKMSDTSRIVERLRLKGLLQRALARTDKRSAEVHITDEGLALLERMKGPVDDLASLLNNLTPEETQQLNMLLEKIRMNHSPEAEKLVHDLELISEPENF